ncbi:MAG: 1-phosphofructokinase family hexose kinase [Oscillospiraceae bacterium]|nr:1-phosphofructokinase family hexose kinase [Oscillospiraceae bacterium]
MIYTLTLNPSLDYIMKSEALIRSSVNRSISEEFRASGKGINVTDTLTALGVENTPIALVGTGFAGDEFMRLRNLKGKGIFIRVKDCDTRINVKLCENGVVTEFNGSFTVTEKDIAALTEKLELLVKGDMLILSGSLPFGVSETYYADIVNSLSIKGICVVVDTSGEALREVVKQSEPFLIKPNQHELGELFCVKIDDFEDAVPYARNMGCKNVLVSMGEMGAVLINKGVYICETVEFKVGYTVGAGDALLAGFIAEYIKSGDYIKSLSAGVKSGTQYITEM